jgi:hypothetical protein
MEIRSGAMLSYQPTYFAQHVLCLFGGNGINGQALPKMAFKYLEALLYLSS